MWSVEKTKEDAGESRDICSSNAAVWDNQHNSHKVTGETKLRNSTKAALEDKRTSVEV